MDNKPQAHNPSKGYNDLKEKIVAPFIEALEKDIVPWRKSWAAPGEPINATTGEPYKGLNALVLSMTSFDSNEYITANQLEGVRKKLIKENADKPQEEKEKLPHIRKGEKATYLVKWVEMNEKAKEAEGQQPQPTENSEAKEAQPRLVPVVFAVFNVNQIENWKHKEKIVIPVSEKDQLERLERVAEALEKTGLTQRVGSKVACYVPAKDELHMPRMENFESVRAYMSVKGHELVHSTAAEHRLNRSEAINNKFGDEKYSKEELVAEIGTYMMAGKLGIKIEESDFQQNAAYIKSWAKQLADKPMELLNAAKQADKAVNYLISNERALFAEQSAENEKNKAIKNAKTSSKAKQPKIEEPKNVDGLEKPKPAKQR